MDCATITNLKKKIRHLFFFLTDIHKITNTMVIYIIYISDNNHDINLFELKNQAKNIRQ